MTTAPTTAPPGSPPAVAKTSRLAIASIICGALGVVTCGVSAVLGLILGIIALTRCGQGTAPGRSRGLAIAGVVVSGFMILGGAAIDLPLLGLLILFRNEIKDWTVDIWEQAQDESEKEQDDFFGEEMDRLDLLRPHLWLTPSPAAYLCPVARTTP